MKKAISLKEYKAKNITQKKNLMICVYLLVIMGFVQ